MGQHRIFCFSPTHHGERLAKCLAACLTGQDPSVQIDSLTLTSQRRQLPNVLEGEFLWLVLPVYAQSIPETVKCFIESRRLHFQAAGICCLYGGKSPGNALRQTARLLQQHNISVVIGAEIAAPHSYRFSLSANDWLEKAAVQRCMCTALANAEQGREAVMPRRLAPGTWFPQRLLARMAVALPKRMPTVCTSCGRCRIGCPVEAIREDLSIDPRRCIRCAACAHDCLQQARPWNLRFWITRWYLSEKRCHPQPARVYGAEPSA